MEYWSDLGHHGWDELWLNHPAVRGWINRRVTGDPAQWPIGLVAQVVPDRLPFRRALSLGCGVGNLERSLAELRLVEHVTGIDVSEEAVRQARNAARGLEDRIDYAVEDARAALAKARDLDAVFFHACLHHFDHLPELLGMVRQALTPRGVLYLDEYVGPARDEWGLRHLLRWNLAYWGLPRRIRRTRIIRRPVNREDPTEAIESSGILPAVERSFRVIARKDYGGNLLAAIYPSLRKPGGESAEFDAAVNSLIAREERVLEREPGLHTVLIAEPKPESNLKSKI